MATLTPIPQQAARSALTPILCLVCGETGGADVARNILLFLPLGLMLATLGVGWLRVLLTGMAVSGAVELLQYAVIAGRDAALGDLVANSLGAVAGHWLASSAPHWLAPPPKTARRLFATWCCLVAGLLLFTRWGLLPDLPDGTWYGQWATGGSEPEFFSGQVLEVRVGGRAVPHWRLPDELRRLVADTLKAGGRLETRIVRGPMDSDGRRIASLASDDARVLALGTEGGDLFFSIRTRSARLRLQSPRFRLPEGLVADEADTLTVLAEYANGRATIASVGPARRSSSIQLTVLDAWLFLGPGTVPGSAGLLALRALVLTVLLGPVWLWRPRRQGR